MCFPALKQYNKSKGYEWAVTVRYGTFIYSIYFVDSIILIFLMDFCGEEVVSLMFVAI